MGLIIKTGDSSVTITSIGDVSAATDNTKAQWTRAYINDLPDSAFLHIENGGKKDEDGKTTPRGLRHLPYRNTAGDVDLPHLRNAIARLAQSDTGESAGESWLTEALRERLLTKARRILDDESKSVDLDELTRQVRVAWEGQTALGFPPLAESDTGWIEKVFDDAIVVNTASVLTRVPYTRAGDKIIFAPRDEWQRVRVEYVPIPAEETNEGKALGKDALVCYGAAVKALGNGRVGGYLVRFGDEEHTDLTLSHDYFTKETDYGPHITSLVFYQHGLDPVIGRRVLDSAATLKADDVGIWIEAQLAMRDAYEKAIYQLAEDRKLGWSSGTAPHLVEREPVGKAHRITRWPLGLDASLTPIPAEPRTCVVPLKSLMPESLLPELAESAEPGGEDDDAVAVAKARAEAVKLLTNL